MPSNTCFLYNPRTLFGDQTPGFGGTLASNRTALVNVSSSRSPGELLRYPFRCEPASRHGIAIAQMLDDSWQILRTN